MHKAYIGIGSNLDNPHQQIEKAIESLQLLSDDGEISCSSLYHSTPLSTGESTTDEPQADYVNAAVSIRTKKLPLELLDALQKIEHEQGRKRSSNRWAARTLDLDILLFDDDIIIHPRLTVPHYDLKQRNFVIYPLSDLDVNLILPDGTTIKELYQSCSSTGINKIE